MNSKKNLNRSKAKVIWSEKLSKLKKRWYHHLDESRQSTVESPWQYLGEQMAIAIDTHRRTRLQFTSVQVLSRSFPVTTIVDETIVPRSPKICLRQTSEMCCITRVLYHINVFQTYGVIHILIRKVLSP